MTRFRFRWGIARVLTLSMLLVVTLAVGLITVLDVERAHASSRQKFEEQGQLLAVAFNETLANPLYFVDINKVAAIVGTAAGQADVKYIQVFRPDGRLLVDTNSPRYAAGSVGEELVARVIRDQLSLRVYREGALEIIAPIRVGRQVLGGVRFGFDTSRLNAEIRTIWVQHLWQGSAIVMVGVVLSFVIARNLVRPLHRLVEATQRIAEGEEQFASGERRYDEIGDLTAAFEVMSGRLGERSAQLNKAMEELRDSRSRMVQAQEELRRDLAEQLHGPVQSRLLVASHWLLAAQQALNTNPDDASEHMRKAGQLIRGITEGDLRDIAHRLHPSLIRLGLLGSLRSLTDTFWPNFEVEIYPSDGAEDPHNLWRTGLPEELRLVIYRVVEEASNNIQKHSKATKVTLRLGPSEGRLGEDWVTLTIQDNGQGFDLQTTPPGFGINAMQDYCAAVGGTLEVQSQIGKGTILIASLPLATKLVEAYRATAT